MRIGLYNPYLAALGGGEKYFLAILEEAARTPGAELTLFSPEEPDVAAWERLNVSVPADAFSWVRAGDAIVTERSREMDLLVTMANDVPVLNHARRAVAMIQFPTVARDAALRRARARLLALAGRDRAPRALASYDLFLCNSLFTREHVAKRLGVEAVVLAPPVDPPPAPFPAPERRRRILSVGRFFLGAHDKRQDVLIRAFAELRTLLVDPAGWELHLAGGADRRASTDRRLEDLRSLALGLPIHFHVNATAPELGELYATSELFWHAAGYRVRADRHPERVEHFGIATAEAMICGAVPLVVPLGGQGELVRDGVNGRHWHSTPELVERAQQLIEDPARTGALRAAARDEAQRYGREHFLAVIRERVLQTAS